MADQSRAWWKKAAWGGFIGIMVIVALLAWQYLKGMRDKDSTPKKSIALASGRARLGRKWTASVSRISFLQREDQAFGMG